MTKWHDTIIKALILDANIKGHGLPTKGDLWIPRPEGGYIKWDMITGEVTTER